MTPAEEILAIIKNGNDERRENAEKFRKIVKDVIDSSPEIVVLDEEE